MQYPDETPRWRRYIRFFQRDSSADIDDELRFHFESRIEELVAQGMTASEARVRALEEFGDVGTVREGLVAIGHRVARRRNRGEWLDGVRADASYSIRSLLR